MKCPTCGKANLTHDLRNIEHTYKGESTTIRKAHGQFCPACDEVIIDGSDAQPVSQAMLSFKKKVNEAHYDPGFIIAVRKKLALDQKQAARIFGGGVNAFSRYETGKTKPPQSLVQLLRVLDKHPKLLEEIKQ